MSWFAGVLRPDPRIYRAALDALGVVSGEAAYVGDGGDGELRGARRLGLRTVLIERGLPHTESARADAGSATLVVVSAAPLDPAGVREAVEEAGYELAHD